MARITVDDCLQVITNRFQLTLKASQKARRISTGTAPLANNRDKPTVAALREIANGQVDSETIQETELESVKSES